MRACLLLLLAVFLVLPASGCSGGGEFDLHGYVAKVEKKRLLIVWGVSKEDVGTLSLNELLDKAAPNAGELNYGGASKFKAGDKVRVRTTGVSDDSYPAIMDGKKVELAEP
ncbi:Protein of unknown function [Paenibacillus sp. UNC496MF]|uniref:DUF3221 domain-containing protein n=1 Tax=Paenibacillus sp. UNC496MF TaxID=1502753 RepID=UPI0008E6D270|nr:DUF3221 domain-containing protein [Paenibacillus sp. UNC496MF]SFI77595.1 Protein of unknown function [Paenibacillus sp. UNC496MF]